MNPTRYEIAQLVLFCRAKAAAVRVGVPGDASGVQSGSYVELHVARVPQSQAEAIALQVNAAAKVCPSTELGPWHRRALRK